MTLLEVLKRATGFLAAHGSSSPRLDAELLLAHSLRLKRIDLYLQFERPLAEPELTTYRDLIARRGRGEPVAYLIGRKEFMGLEFEVTPDVLVPNPDTEILVQRAIEWGKEKEGALVLADVGTGSGCIAIAVAHYLPAAQVHASDISAAALAVAGRNLRTHGLESRVHLHQGDLLAPLPAGLDAILANLPYLEDASGLPKEVTAQPAAALFGGAELITRLLAEAPRKLKPGGLLLAELDPAIAAELQIKGYREHRLIKDLRGHDRVLEAWT